jgi:hypothetical protein
MIVNKARRSSKASSSNPSDLRDDVSFHTANYDDEEQ